jgi:uncharacterized protein YceH (UPF0502 family)
MNQSIDVAEQKKWKPIGPAERRVLGVLVEKSKTTPDIYPMTVNAIATAANQKSNRHPIMQMSPEDVEDALSHLRNLGAVVEIQGDGRKLKYKHTLYQWLGVERAQLAVMAELLLRGEQTIGELRARAARMERINDVAELRPIVDAMTAANLVIPLTPAGRGQLITHNLYLADELHQMELQYQSGSGGLDEFASPQSAKRSVDLPDDVEFDGETETRRHAPGATDNPAVLELARQLESVQERLASIEQRIDALEQLMR